MLPAKTPHKPDPASYYRDVTKAYCTYGHDRGFHYALWETGKETWDQALDASNSLLLSGLKVCQSSQILDVGCGIGGFAIWCAQKTQANVTGLNICPSHIRMAEEKAEEASTSNLCSFQVMDMNCLESLDGAYDIVVNQESFCYAQDKKQYLQQVHRLLKPGGIWTAIVFSRQNAPFSRHQNKLYEKMLKGFHIPGLFSGERILTELQAAGFCHCTCNDITHMTHPTARKMIRYCYVPLALGALGLGRLLFPGDSDFVKNHIGHFSAGKAYSTGLLQGFFRHHLIQAYKP